MAFPNPKDNVAGIVSTWDKTANTFKRDVDSKLWPALQAKSPILDMLARPKVGNFKFEWEVDNAPTRLYTANGANAATTIGNHATNGDIVFTTSVADLQLGTILRNASRATTIGSYGMDELLEVAAIDGQTVTVNRDVGSQAAGSGSLLQCYTGSATANDVYEVVYVPVPEGSAPGVNRYKDVSLVENYANTVDFYLTVTGDQLATDRLIAADNMANQFQKNMTMLTNQLEGMFFYGALAASGHEAGDAGYIRRTKGFDYWVAAAGGNYDVTTRKVTPAALDKLFYEILADNTDPSDTFIIATHPSHARTISSFGIDKVRLGQEESKYGRYIDTYKSDLGVEAKVIWSLNISKADLFIIDMNKVSLPVFRPFEKAEWSYGDDGVDAYRQRIIGSFGVKVVDALYSHAKLGLLW